MTDQRSHIALLALIVVALIVIGIASHELVRHVIQSAPALFAVLLGVLGVRPVKWMAAPIFAVWLLICVLIWLYLLGLSQVIDGTFSVVEIAMTIVIGICCVAGLYRIVRRPGGTAWYAALALFALFGVAQVGAMQVSFQPAFAHD